MTYNPSRFLQNEGGSDPYSLAITTFSGAFNSAWQQPVSLWDTAPIYKLNQKGNKAFQVLRMAALPEPVKQYQAGDSFPGQQYEMNDTTITVEPYIRSGFSIRRDDMNISQVEIMPRLAQGVAMKLKYELSRRVANLACQAARATSETKNGLLVHNGGNVVTKIGGTSSGVSPNLLSVITGAYPFSSTGSDNLRKDLRQLSLNMTTDGVPTGSQFRSLYLYHDLKTVLSYDTTNQVFSRDFVSNGNDMQSQILNQIEGFSLIDTVGRYPAASGVRNLLNDGILPDGNFAFATDLPTKYQANFAVGGSTGFPVALSMCRGLNGDCSVAAGIWEGPFVQTWYDEETLTYHIDAAVQVGMGIMSPWCAGSIEVIT